MSSSTTPYEQGNRINDDARAALTASLTAVGSSISYDMHARATNLHSNAAHLTKQQADVSNETATLERQNDQLQKMANNSRDKIKEIGDVQNWAEIMERDLLILEETLRMAEGGDYGYENGHDNGNGNSYPNGK
ncbi:MAG: hypothetical protein M4579_003009 [Chaenotheca gracillima]|nr:MAG: hypothetical protein M4579_003009 [Chaenotheca gracillima]